MEIKAWFSAPNTALTVWWKKIQAGSAVIKIL